MGTRIVHLARVSGLRVVIDENDRNDLLTIDQLAARFGLTARTIRSYHARGLLQPPARCGRTSYYGPAHLARMRYILRLRTSGLPLEAVRVLVEPDQVIGELFRVDRMVATALEADPKLSVPLVSAGVLLPLPDGALQVLSPRAVLTAYMAARPGVTTVSMLRIIADSVLEAEPHARATLVAVRQTMRRHISRELGGDELVGLTIEILRLCLNR